jgi:hypothetical protein
MAAIGRQASRGKRHRLSPLHLTIEEILNLPQDLVRVFLENVRTRRVSKDVVDD